MFTPIAFNTWPRREMFYYFSKMAPTGYSLTVNLDVTQIEAECFRPATLLRILFFAASRR